MIVLILGRMIVESATGGQIRRRETPAAPLPAVARPPAAEQITAEPQPVAATA
jgi:cellulose synthase (UDP-forming)